MQSSGTPQRITIQPRVHFLGRSERQNPALGDGAAGVVVPDGGHDRGGFGAGVAAPDEVEAGGADVELVLAGRDGGVHQGHRVGHGLVGGGAGEAGVDGLLDAEDEEDEEEGGEELEEGRPLVPPRQQQVLREQRPVLLQQQRRPALQRHGSIGFSIPRFRFLDFDFHFDWLYEIGRAHV